MIKRGLIILYCRETAFGSLTKSAMAAFWQLLADRGLEPSALIETPIPRALTDPQKPARAPLVAGETSPCRLNRLGIRPAMLFLGRAVHRSRESSMVILPEEEERAGSQRLPQGFQRLMAGVPGRNTLRFGLEAALA